LLKNRAVKQTSEEKLWYDRAFGPSRNVMNIRFRYAPPPDKAKTVARYFVELNYDMFPEI
jgi:hypothetical protein